MLDVDFASTAEIGEESVMEENGMGNGTKSGKRVLSNDVDG